MKLFEVLSKAVEIVFYLAVIIYITKEMKK